MKEEIRMAKFHDGFKDIKVELISYAGNDLARQVCCFGQRAEFYTGFSSIKDYSPENPTCKQIVDEIINGVTFPKYALEGHKVTFSIQGISRINLAQFTREGTTDTGTFFCSASSGTRPLTQDLIIPMNIYSHKDWMDKYAKINKELESLYCEMLDYGIPFMDARYLMPHAQTIDICYTASMKSFIGSCCKRLDHCIADEINYIYRLMKNELIKAIEKDVTDPLSKQLWKWLLDKADVKRYSTNLTYRNDFTRYELPKDLKFNENAHNDWRKSQWKMELERIRKENPELLANNEKEMIDKWMSDEKNGIPLKATYDSSDKFTPESSVKEMYYYENI